MSKVKEYSKRIMCILSAGMFFFMALFYPLESFKADMSSAAGNPLYVTLQHDYNHNDIMPDSTANYLHERHVVTYSMVNPDDFALSDYTEFDYLLGEHLLMATSEDVFAYQITATASSQSLRLEGVRNVFLSVGTYDDIIEGNVCTLGSFWNGPLVTTWYVNDFKRNNLFVGFIARVIYFENEYGSSINSVRLLGSTSYSIVPYTVADLTDEIYKTLQDIYSNDQQVLTALLNIYYSNDTVENKLQSLVSFAESQLAYLMEIKVNTDQIETLLGVCNSYLSSIQSELQQQTSWLQKIYNAIIEYFGMQGDDSVDEMPSDDMDNMLNIESELLGDASASDLQNDLTVSIDADSSNFIWDIINRLITANSIVFGGFISVLSLGIVALILGR